METVLLSISLLFTVFTLKKIYFYRKHFYHPIQKDCTAAFSKLVLLFTYVVHYIIVCCLCFFIVSRRLHSCNSFVLLFGFKFDLILIFKPLYQTRLNRSGSLSGAVCEASPLDLKGQPQT